MHKFKTLGLSLVATAAVLASPVRDDLAAKSIAYSEEFPPTAFVEYIESTGTQFLSTGIVPTRDTVWEVDVMYTTFSGEQLMGSGYAGSSRFNIGVSSYSYYAQFRVGFGTSWFNTGHQKDLERHLWVLSTEDNICFSQIDGGSPVRISSSYSPYTYPIYLFARSGYQPLTERCYCRIYGCRIWYGDVLQAHLVPYRFVNELGFMEGGMLDLVSGQIRRNLGTDSFIIGPDL